MENPEASRVLEIRLFSAFDVRLNGVPLPSLRTRKGQWLLALLALRRDRPVDRAWLAGTLWPETTEDHAFTSLRKCLSDLRQALGTEAHRLYAPTPRTLAFDLSGAFCDVADFDAAFARGSREGLEQAVSLYRGPLLEECPDDWMLLERSARCQSYLQALENLGTSALETGNAAGAIEHLRLCIVHDPLRETAHRALMQALAKSGNPAAVTQVYRDLRLYLRRELRADPAPETIALYERIRAEASRCVQPPARRSEGGKMGEHSSHSNLHQSFLPCPVTELVGRKEEIEEVKASLTRARLVTLTGTGGVGKTRLAIEVAQRCQDDHRDGVWFVDLAVLSDPSLVLPTVASVLGVREQSESTLKQTLIQYLKERELLLVLDNCEHVLTGCVPLTAILLPQCPSLRLLATSRQALGIAGEVVWRVPSLSLPDVEPLLEHRNKLWPPAGYDAIRLFVDRAFLLRPQFRLTAQNVRSVAQICRRLDGIPLAIELAAARIRVLTPEQIAVRLNNLFHLLTGGSLDALPRQQTLRATLDWSYDLLSEAERAVWRCLSVFSGGWTLEAAETVCAESGSDDIRKEDVLDLLTALVDKSLVYFEPCHDEEGRYRMLETVRQYGQERLRECGEGSEVCAGHLDYYLMWAEEARRKLDGAEQVVWLDRLESEHDNLRAALQFCAGHRGAEKGGISFGEKQLRLVLALSEFWDVRGYWSEGRKQLTNALSCTMEVRPELRMKALIAVGNLARKQGDMADASAYFEESLTLAKELGDQRMIASVLRNLGTLAVNQSEFGRARSFFEESLAMARELDDRRGMAVFMVNIATITQPQGDYETTFRYLKESLSISHELGDRTFIGVVLNNLGNAAYHQGDYEAARSYQEQNLVVRREMGDRKGISNALFNLGTVILAQGDCETARRLFEESLAIRREIGELPMIGYSLHNLGLVALQQGDYATAHSLLRESLPIFQQTSDRYAMVEGLETFARLAALEGRATRAAQLYAIGARLREELGTPQSPNMEKEYNAALHDLRAALGEERFDVAWEHGDGVSLEDAVSYALSDS